MQEEIIYDYMSEEELLDWFYPGVQREVREKYNLKIPTREEYIQSTTPTQRIFDLYRLGLNRRDKEFAKKYFDMLETPKKYEFYTGIALGMTMMRKNGRSLWII